MARTNFVKSARKPQGNCRSCGKPINIGDPYKWAKPRYRGKVVVCEVCQITISMTSSSKMVAVWEVISAFDDSDVTSIPEGLRDLAGTAREVGEEYQDSADNQREYFPDSDVAEENEERAQNLESWADDLESKADEIENELTELEDLKQELEELQVKDDKTEEDNTRLEELPEDIESKEEDIRSEAQDIIGEQPE